MNRSILIASCSLLAGATAVLAQGVAPGDWPNYGRDPGGSRYSPLTRITRENVSQLTEAWTYHTGETGTPERGAPPALETTPILVDGTLYLSTPYGRVIALDPTTGTERWKFDPKLNGLGGYGDFTNRGVSTWLDARATAGTPCRRRIIIATVDAHLIALDAQTGDRCAGFGEAGIINLRKGLRTPPFEFPAYEETSPPAVVNDLIVVGSAIGDNSRTNPASGEVRAFDARTGKLRWTWHPIPRDPADPAFATWEPGSPERTGAANAWSVIASDPARDLVFVPTSSPAPDYYGGLRQGANRYGNSLVALRASTGKVVWHFQLVHHDIWDYDNASPPALVTVRSNGRTIPAVLQGNKSGMLFVLNRETGTPIFPVEERPVPASDVEGERTWPTQPFTTQTPPLAPHRVGPGDVWGATPADRDACAAELASLRNEGVFTPPSTRGTLVVPSNIGGAHWGGVAADGGRGIAVIPVNNLAAVVQLIPDEAFDRDAARRERQRLGWQYTEMEGTGFIMRRRIWLSPGGLPCTRPPFGSLVAVSLSTGAILWKVPLGALPVPGEAAPSGSPNLGGPIVTASGVTFIGATLDRAIRAFDIETGRELWRHALPAGARATPMTYEVAGRQYVVIAAGGGDRFGNGDAIVAFALPAPRP